MVSRNPSTRNLLRSGTGSMVLGTLLAAVGAYLFQLVAGRALGPESFAPITVLWTIQFIVFTTVFMPLEQLTIRRLNREAATATPWRLFVGAIAASTLVSTLIAVLLVDRFFDGNWTFVMVTIVLIASYGAFALGRGVLAGHRRYHEYGMSTFAESWLRLAVAGALLALGAGTIGLAWSLVVGALVVFLWRPFADIRTDEAGIAPEIGVGVALAGYIAANAAAQSILAAGPLVVAALGAPAADVSVFFETFLLFRAPLTIAYSLVARVLGPFTKLVESGRARDVRTWAFRIGIGGAALAGAGYLAGRAVGPAIVALMLGEEFRPSATLAALAAAGMVLATVSLFLQQLLIARSDTNRLAVAWGIGLAASIVALIVVGGAPVERVATSFLVGEGVAFGLLVLLAADRH